MDRTVQPLRNYIDGKFSSPTVEMGVWLEDPNTREPLQKQMASADDDIERALAAAQAVHETGLWSEMPVEERCDYLAAFFRRSR